MVQQALGSVAWRDDIRVTSARPEWVSLEVQCKLDAAERATHLARELASDLDPNAAEDVTSAFRELLLNGIEHGGKSNPHKRVRVSLLRVAGCLMVKMRDPGKGFSFDKIKHAAVSNPEDSPTRHVEIRAEKGQRPGGFGILMARSLVDQLVYNERGNEVVFVKKLTKFHSSSETS
jgi:anti-sigma regulatory factor (Ser/Thr protein kinase)